MSVRRIFWLLSLALLAAGLAACMSAPPAPPAPAPPSVEPAKPPAAPTAAAATPEVPAAPTAAPIAADDAWSRIQKSGVIRVGSPLDNPPFNMRNDEFQPDGFDVALMNELAAQLGLKAQFDDYGFDGLLGALQLDQIDAAIAAMAITPARQEVADFTSAYYVGEDIVLAAVGLTHHPDRRRRRHCDAPGGRAARDGLRNLAAQQPGCDPAHAQGERQGLRCPGRRGRRVGEGPGGPGRHGSRSRALGRRARARPKRWARACTSRTTPSPCPRARAWRRN